MQCAETLRAQAYFDRELDSPGAAEIERHALHCGRCCRALEDLKQVRAAPRRELEYRNVPAALQARIARALNHPSVELTPVHRWKFREWRPGVFWGGAFPGIGSTAIAASLAFFAVSQPSTISLSEELLSAHVRSLMPDHLIVGV